jgi:hypothetical protein
VKGGESRETGSFVSEGQMVILEISRIHRVDSRLVYTVARDDDMLRWLVGCGTGDWMWSEETLGLGLGHARVFDFDPLG